MYSFLLSVRPIWWQQWTDSVRLTDGCFGRRRNGDRGPGSRNRNGYGGDHIPRRRQFSFVRRQESRPQRVPADTTVLLVLGVLLPEEKVSENRIDHGIEKNWNQSILRMSQRNAIMYIKMCKSTTTPRNGLPIVWSSFIRICFMFVYLWFCCF